MAVSDPTSNYGWLLPDVGGDIGAWGGILNAVIGADADEAVKGIDEVIHDLQLALDAAEADIVDIAARVTTLEAGIPAALATRLSLSGAFTIPSDVDTKILWGTVDFDKGSISVADGTVATVPVDGTGLWQLRAQVEIPYHGGGAGNDNGRWVYLRIVKNGSEVIGNTRHPYTDNGSDSTDTGNVTLNVAVLDQPAAGDTYEVWCSQGGVGKSVQIADTVGTYFEAIRITREA